MRTISFGSKHATGWLKYGQVRVWVTFGIAFIAFVFALATLFMVID
ncbi:MAG: hypothetical protein K0S60_679 [Evtepia sp.]|nr:hypothetical protein [Evtepia sp.]